MIIQMLIRQGEIDTTDWTVDSQLEKNGTGLNILSKREGLGRVILVEFVSNGIVWRRAVFGLLAPYIKGVQMVLTPLLHKTTVQSIEGAFKTENNGGMPILSLAVGTGNALIPAMAVTAVVGYELQQQRKISGEDKPTDSSPYEGWLNLFVEDDDDETNWANQPSMTFEAEFEEVDTKDVEPYVPPEEDDFNYSAFEGWDDEDGS